ncbi:T9SS type A sorting domain-containing protein [Gelidibacter maritimus]|uniref:T9SS type A sorting domain-containing protein n=1 Tax=Gelidibacter maritimus TaxID=2761487 RepID=A0A7W2M3K1_9FLAO|nr:T9SS type A sorting domain-containing protein [Gelidibacter maritimus]MBA6152058.1 T9SS type A sorting domain-containing protein [Gelidibacter maritimus]
MKQKFIFSFFSRKNKVSKFLVILLCLGNTMVQGQDWEQMGTDINGVNNGDHSGVSVSMSNDGQTIAIGSFSNQDNSTTTGHVRIFSHTGIDWVIKGDPITGLDTERGVGSSVSLSGDGNRIAICITSDGTPARNGKIRIFDWNGTSWGQVGNDLLWHGGSVWMGSVALSNNGQVVAVGDYSYSTSEDFSGQVRLYTLNGNTWQQRGSSITGTAGGLTGSALSISNDGDVFATNLQDEIQVYRWNETDYVPKGTILNPFSLKHVTLNGNGNWAAVSGENANGETENKGAIQVYKWDGSSWKPEGIPIQGEPESRFGHALSFSDDAQVLAISSISNMETTSPGHVRVFVQNGSNWEQTGNTIIGPQFLDYYGNSISLNARGNIIGIGAPGYLVSNYGFKDRTQVFRNDEVMSVPEVNQPEFALYPNPTTSNFTIELGKEYSNVSIQILDMLGTVISSTNYKFVKSIEAQINGPTGTYFVNVGTSEGFSKSFKFIKN